VIPLRALTNGLEEDDCGSSRYVQRLDPPSQGNADAIIAMLQYAGPDARSLPAENQTDRFS
jgi:hypothetical protein